jgi:methionyl-tRNA synthetase
MARFYITTPIYYINAEPHLGHAYTTMVADAIARSRRLMGQDVFFLTGTMNTARKSNAPRTRPASRRGVRGSDRREDRELFQLLNISNDDFIRTTEARHIRRAGNLARARSRALYKATYEGWIAR